jgi:hypothetical protein
VGSSFQAQSASFWLKWMYACGFCWEIIPATGKFDSPAGTMVVILWKKRRAWDALVIYRCRAESHQEHRLQKSHFVLSGNSPKKGFRSTTMCKLRTLFFPLAATVMLCSVAIAQSHAPTVRIVDRIDENNLVTLKGNTLPVANARNDRGRVSPTLPMSDLILVLSRDAAQQAAFEKFVASQYDSTSPSFHQWLTPEQVGENFGPSEADIASISNWLTGHGFTINQVTKDRMSIRFSGTAAQVESAFHTEIHNLNINGAAHIGNMSDPQIPAALAPVVIGVKALHNVFPRPLHRMGSTVQRDSATGKWKRLASVAATGSATNRASTASTLGKAARTVTKARPQFGINGSENGYPYLVEDVGPWDFAAIYNVTPLWSASTPIDGTGQTIAIAGTSSIRLGDVATFRSTFDLPTANSYNTPILQSGNGQSPTVCTDTTGDVPYSDNACELDDQLENALDVEWSGSVAKNAQIVLVSSYPASETDDTLYDSASYIVDNVGSKTNPSTPVYNARIMNVSYGECELLIGTAGNVQYYNLWQTAASEGIAVFVAAGDAGSAECDGDLGNPVAEYGPTVSGLASTPWNTAVGGTDLNWCSPDTAFGSSNSECSVSTNGVTYWNSTNNGTTNASAAGYIPETPWNDTCSNPLALSWMQDLASYIYGISNSDVSSAEQGCNFIADFSYSGVNPYTGADGLGDIDPYAEYLVDTVGGAGGASNCVVSSTTATTTGTCSTSANTTGTSNGAIPLSNDGWIKPAWQSQSGVTGMPSDGVRDIPDVSFFASDGYLSSSAYLICVSDLATCSYSSQIEPVELEVGGTSVSSPAMAGVMALINQKAGAAQGNPNSELYALAAKQSYSSCSAESVTNSGSCYFNDIDKGTNAMPCDYGGYVGISLDCYATQSTLGSADEVGILPGYSAGTGYDLATGLGSLNVANVVNAFAGIESHFALVTVTPASSSTAATQSLSVTVSVASGYSGGATPTGTVTLTSGSYNSGTQTLATSGSCTAASCAIVIPADSLSAGTDTLTANYSGDSIYAAESNAATVTVTSTTPAFSLAATALTIASPGATSGNTSTVTVTPSNFTGTVTLTCSVAPTTETDTPTCTGSTVTISSSSTAETGTITINTTAPTTSTLVSPKVPGKSRGWIGAGSGAVLAFLVFLGIPARRRSWRKMLGMLILLVVLGTVSACGGGGSSTGTTTVGGTTPGTYTVTVTGKGTDKTTSAAVTNSTTFSLVVE